MIILIVIILYDGALAAMKAIEHIYTGSGRLRPGRQGNIHGRRPGKQSPLPTS